MDQSDIQLSDFWSQIRNCWFHKREALDEVNNTADSCWRIWILKSFISYLYRWVVYLFEAQWQLCDPPATVLRNSAFSNSVKYLSVLCDSHRRHRLVSYIALTGISVESRRSFISLNFSSYINADKQSSETGLSSWRSRFNARPIFVRFLWRKWLWTGLSQNSSLLPCLYHSKNAPY